MENNVITQEQYEYILSMAKDFPDLVKAKIKMYSRNELKLFTNLMYQNGYTFYNKRNIRERYLFTKNPIKVANYLINNPINPK